MLLQAVATLLFALGCFVSGLALGRYQSATRIADLKAQIAPFDGDHDGRIGGSAKKVKGVGWGN